MGRLFRAIRGAVGIGLTWAVAWVMVGGLLSLALAPLGITVDATLTWAILGLFSGSAFSVALGMAGRRNTFDEMSLRYFAVGGGLATLLIYAYFGHWSFQSLEHWAWATSIGLVGAGFASGSLAVARRATHEELLEANEDVAEIGLTDREARVLLGGTG